MTQKEFEQLIPELRHLMLKVGSDFFGSTMDAEDVAQESLARLWLNLERLDSSRDLSSLAIKVAKNVCIYIYRRHVRPKGKIPDSLSAPLSDNADAGIAAEECLADIEFALNLLTPSERSLLNSRVNQGKSSSDISAETGIPKASVMSIISKAKKKVKTIIRNRT